MALYSRIALLSTCNPDTFFPKNASTKPIKNGMCTRQIAKLCLSFGFRFQREILQCSNSFKPFYSLPKQNINKMKNCEWQWSVM